MVLEVKVEVSSGIFESVNNAVKKMYEKSLNANGYFEVLIGGSDTDYFSEFDTGKLVYFYANDSLDFIGEVLKVDYTDEGLLRLRGNELGPRRFSKPSASNNVYSSDTNEDILDDLIANVSGVSKGTVNSVSVDDFRTYLSQSCLEVGRKLAGLLGQDLYFSYSGGTTSVNLVNHQGSSSSVVTLVGGIDISRVKREKDDFDKVTKVTVIGAGEGDNQINGSYGPSFSQGDNEKTIIDKSIVSNDEADARAEEEYNVLSQTRFNYEFMVLDPNRDFVLGDVLSLKDSKTNTDSDVRITRLKRLVVNNNESLRLEVRNTGEREAAEDLLSQMSLERSAQREANSFKQGQLNYIAWGEGINAKNGAPAKVVFKVDDTMKDLAGNLNVLKLLVDYDLDGFRAGAGSASEDNVAPSVSGASTVLHQHDPSDSGHVHSINTVTSNNSEIFDYEGVDTTTSASLSVGWNSNVCSEFISGTFTYLFVRVEVEPQFSNSNMSCGIRINGSAVNNDVQDFVTNVSTSVLGGYMFRKVYLVEQHISASGDVDLDVYSTVSGSFDCRITVWGLNEAHDHDIDALTGTQSSTANVSDDNKSPSLSGSAASHNHNVSVGDDVTESGTVNSTEVDLYLDYWNGSSWVNKHSILNTGFTIDTDVDISNSGAYPDATGFWRVRIDPSSSSPDFVNGIVKITSSLDS